MNRRLTNVKTREEAGLNYVIAGIDLQTPFGKKIIKQKKPFFCGEEELLKKELDRIGKVLTFVEENPKAVSTLAEIFMDMKDPSFTVERSQTSALSVVELFEVKSILLKMKAMRDLLNGENIDLPKEYYLEDITRLLDALDPRGDRLNTFYIYEEFSVKLTDLRRKKREQEKALRRIQKEKKELIDKEYGIRLTPKFDYSVSKADEDELKLVRSIPCLEQADEDYMSVIFALKNTEEMYQIIGEIERINGEAEEEEEAVRRMLSEKIWSFQRELTANCGRIGEFDIALAKAIYAREHDCTKPEITDEHIIEVEDGRHLLAEDILKSKDKEYCPVSISLADGVTCITGANMGGKTVSLKLVGLVAILAQYGFFVPCRRAKVGLSNFMQMLIGDSQSMERGLSSFGSEMEELKEILDNSKDRSMLLVDEIASGTNPAEGLALTRSLIDYLKDKPYISLITTHFDTVTRDEEIKNMQVVGLANADFTKLNKEIKYANRRERINIIAKYMDYRLYAAESGKEIPKDALNIAKMLGIDDEIINKAKDYIKK